MDSTGRNILLTLLIAILTAAGLDGTANAQTKHIQQGDTVKVSAEEYRFVPDKLIAPPEVRFTLIFRNTGNLTHNLYFDREEYRTATVSPPSADTIQVTTSSAPDTLLYWCDVVGHRDAGMEGMLVVKR